jgi:hypothetical protein
MTALHKHAMPVNKKSVTFERSRYQGDLLLWMFDPAGHYFAGRFIWHEVGWVATYASIFWSLLQPYPVFS